MLVEIMKLQGISKGFPGVQALEDVSLDLKSGEIHALLGENGAGKSTLIKIISGVQRPDKGEIFFEGNKVRFNSPKEAQNAGINAAFQEEALFMELSVAENVFMNDLPNRSGLLKQAQLYKNTQTFLQSIGLSINPSVKIKHLSTAQRQLIQVARAILASAKVLIFDEPATALTPVERQTLLSMINKLKERGTGIIFITHHLEESLTIADRITILRDGRKMITAPASTLSENQIIHYMVGRELLGVQPDKAEPSDSVIMECSGLTNEPFYRDISFQLHKGEVLGIAGLAGCGKSELAAGLFGIKPVKNGQIKLSGRTSRIKSPKDAIGEGLFLVPQDRSQALLLSKSIRENISLPSIKKLSSSGIVLRQEENKAAAKISALLHVRSPSVETVVGALSGGNRQKVLIGRAHLTDPQILILVEPTLGIDVGARREIYQTIHQLAREGRSIVLISSDISEVVGVSHRVLVMHEGRINGELKNEGMHKDAVISLMSHVKNIAAKG